jgi:hypothetical protein
MRSGGTFIRQDLINAARPQEVSVIRFDTDGKLLGYLLRFAHMSLIQKPFDSYEPSADPMSLKPVDFDPAEAPIHQVYHRHPLPLSPSAQAKASTQHKKDMNTPTDSDGLNLSHLSYDLNFIRRPHVGHT